MDGKLLSPTYLLVAESTGKFPSNKPSDPPNIKAYARKTANMNKDNLKTFLRDIFWPQMTKEHVMLIVDSWIPNKDDDLYKKEEPVGRKLEKLLIPGKCTGSIQPLDVGFFRPYNNFVKFVTDTVIATDDFNIWNRDNFIRLQSFAHFQFSTPLFRNLILHVFWKSGYLKERPEQYVTPIEYCFDFTGADECSESGCLSPCFFRCAHCTDSFCLNHALIQTLHIYCC